MNYSGKHYHYQGIGKKETLMHIGVCTIQLYMHSSRSLKDKRQILRSITDRLRQKFNVTVAEIENNDSWNTATLGIVCLSNDRKFTNELISKTITFVNSSRLPAEVLDISTEIISGSN